MQTPSEDFSSNSKSTHCTKLSDVCYPRNNAHCGLDITDDDNVLLQKVIVTGTVPDKTQNTCS